MTDTLNAEVESNVDESAAAYEAMRDEPEAGTETIVEPEGEGEPEPDKPELSETDKLKASLKNRSGEARREKEARRAAEERAAALEVQLEALQGKKSPDLSLDDIDATADPIGAVERMAAIIKAQQAQSQQSTQAQQAEAQQRKNVQDLSN